MLARHQGGRAAALPDGVLEQLVKEACFLLILVLKRMRIAYTPELAITQLAVPILFLAMRSSACVSDGAIERRMIATMRSDALNR